MQQEERLFFNFDLSDRSTYKYGEFLVRVRKGVTLETKLAKFENCVDLYFDIPGSIDDEHGYVFAPGIGIVKEYGAWVRREVTSYQLKSD